jgi:hypothetical protein
MISGVGGGNDQQPLQRASADIADICARVGLSYFINQMPYIMFLISDRRSSNANSTLSRS